LILGSDVLFPRNRRHKSWGMPFSSGESFSPPTWPLSPFPTRCFASRSALKRTPLARVPDFFFFFSRKPPPPKTDPFRDHLDTFFPKRFFHWLFTPQRNRLRTSPPHSAGPRQTVYGRYFFSFWKKAAPRPFVFFLKNRRSPSTDGVSREMPPSEADGPFLSGGRPNLGLPLFALDGRQSSPHSLNPPLCGG